MSEPTRRSSAIAQMDQVEKPHFSHTFLSILGYQEDDEWVALALEMDLRGYGATFEEALGELQELVMMQISFALQQDQPELIWKSAEPRFHDMWERGRRDTLLQRASRAPTSAPQVKAGSLEWPSLLTQDEEFLLEHA